MANYKHYMNTNYAGCRLLAEAYDHCRARNVRLFALPGRIDVVGVTDGVDKWIAPARNELFSVPALDLLRDPSKGVYRKTAVVQAARQRVRAVHSAAPRQRRRAVIK